MNQPDNLKIIQQMYHSYGSGDMKAVLSVFDPAVTWIEPGDPDIPFAGVFKGIDGLQKMFGVQAKTIRVKSFVPKNFVSSGNTVAVLGSDTVDVIPTGKTYNIDWVQSFTFANGKIIHVQVYMDTLAIAKAFLP